VAALRTDLVAIHKELKTQASVAKQQRLNLTGALQDRADNLISDVEEAARAAGQFCQQVRTAKTAAAFNAGIQKAARDVTQKLGNIDTFVKRGATLKIKGKQPNELVKSLTPYAQAHVTLPATANAKEVEDAVEAFEGLIAQVNQWVNNNK
jgi:hypothetical protein